MEVDKGRIGSGPRSVWNTFRLVRRTLSGCYFLRAK